MTIPFDNGWNISSVKNTWGKVELPLVQKLANKLGEEEAEALLTAELEEKKLRKSSKVLQKFYDDYKLYAKMLKGSLDNPEP